MNDFAIRVILLLSKTDFDIADVRHCKTCDAIQRVRVTIEKLEVFQDECIRGWTFLIWMLDLVGTLLCFLAPFDTSRATLTAQINPINDR